MIRTKLPYIGFLISFMLVVVATAVVFYLSTKPVMNIEVFEPKQKDYVVETATEYRPSKKEQDPVRKRAVFERADVQRVVTKLPSTMKKVEPVKKPAAKLIGIMSGVNSAAIFEVAGKARSFSKGEKIEGWTIETIAAEEVLLSYSGQKHTLLFDESVFQKNSARPNRSRFRTRSYSRMP